jgi:hypothetical protein
MPVVYDLNISGTLRSKAVQKNQTEEKQKRRDLAPGTGGPRSYSESMLAFDYHVRCVLVLGTDGSLRTSASREGLVSLEPEEVTTRMLYQTIIGMGMGSSENRYHGKIRAIVIVRERLSLILFPLFDELVLVSVDPGFPLERTAEMARLLDTNWPAVSINTNSSLIAGEATPL